ESPLEQIRNLVQRRICLIGGFDRDRRLVAIREIVRERIYRPPVGREIGAAREDTRGRYIAYSVDHELRFDDAVAGIVDHSPRAVAADIGAVVAVRRLGVLLTI